MSPQLIGLLAAISYALSFILARQGLQNSSPFTMTCVAFGEHTLILWAAVFFTGGIPEVEPLAILLFVILGVFQLIIRLMTFTGVSRIGASRTAPLRNAYPLWSAVIAVTLLHEAISLAVLSGTLLVVMGITLISWKSESQASDYRWWNVLFPLGASLLAGIAYPIRRYALTLSNHPLFFGALVGLVSLLSLAAYVTVPTTKERPVWNRQAMPRFLLAGLFETLGILLVLTALSLGPVVLVAPIVATQPLWTLLAAGIFLRALEQITPGTVLGTICVVVGTVAIYLAR